MNDWCKCNFCRNTAYDACDWCSSYDGYKPDPDALIEVSKRENIPVADVISLIEYCGGQDE